MPKQTPSRPDIPIPSETADHGTARHRVCGTGRAALAKVAQLEQRLQDHAESDDDRLDAIGKDVDAVTRKVDTLDDHVGDLRVDVAKMSTTLETINSNITAQNEIKHVRVIAEVEADIETRKSAQIAAINDEADRKKARRALLLKAALILVTAAGTVLGILLARYH